MPHVTIDQPNRGGDSGPLPYSAVEQVAGACRDLPWHTVDSGTSKWFIQHLKYGAQQFHMARPTPFNLRFENGKEYLSVMVPEERVPLVTALMKSVEDPKASIKSWACFYIGREFDLDRCAGVAMRAIAGQLEIRLCFDPPWYFPELLELARVRSLSTTAD